jgi:hypothetical protein
LFTNSLDGEEKKKFPQTKELPSGTLMKKFAHWGESAKLNDNFQLKKKRKNNIVKSYGIMMEPLEMNPRYLWLVWIHHSPLHLNLEAIAF